MNILAVECSGKVAGVAVTKEDFIACEIYLDGQLTHSQVFMPMVEECLERANLEFGDIDVIACNVGPGSFTGVRIGCSTANALHMATGAKLVSVDALEALVYNLLDFDGWVVPMLDARADRLYAGIYKHGQSIMTPQACNVEGLIAALPKEGSILLLGEGAELHFKTMLEALASRVSLAPIHLRRHRPGALAALAMEKQVAGKTVDRCLPIYLRPSQAEQEREKKVR